MSVRVRWLPLLSWLGAGGFVVLTVLVAAHVLDGLDGKVFQLCHHHWNRHLYRAADHFTNLFSPPVDAGCLALGAAALARRRRKPAVFLAAVLSAGTMAAIVLVTKAALDRPLPDHPGRHAEAFPSGHTATFLVCFGTLALLATTRRRDLRPRLLTAVGVGTALIAASLVYDGFHWLTDTIASASLGVSLLSSFALAADAGRRNRPQRPR